MNNSFFTFPVSLPLPFPAPFITRRLFLSTFSISLEHSQQAHSLCFSLFHIYLRPLFFPFFREKKLHTVSLQRISFCEHTHRPQKKREEETGGTSPSVLILFPFSVAHIPHSQSPTHIHQLPSSSTLDYISTTLAMFKQEHAFKRSSESLSFSLMSQKEGELSSEKGFGDFQFNKNATDDDFCVISNPRKEAFLEWMESDDRQSKRRKYISSDHYYRIMVALEDPANEPDSNFRFYCKRRYLVSSDDEGTKFVVTSVDNRRVAKKEELYEIIEKYHLCANHARAKRTWTAVSIKSFSLFLSPHYFSFPSSFSLLFVSLFSISFFRSSLYSYPASHFSPLLFPLSPFSLSLLYRYPKSTPTCLASA